MSLTGEPTYWPTDRNKIPDMIYLVVPRSLPSSFTDVTEVIDLYFDHSPIVETLRETIITRVGILILATPR